MPSWYKRRPTWRIAHLACCTVLMRKTASPSRLTSWTGPTDTGACCASPHRSTTSAGLTSVPRLDATAGFGTSATGWYLLMLLRVGDSRVWFPLVSGKLPVKSAFLVTWLGLPPRRQQEIPGAPSCALQCNLPWMYPGGWCFRGQVRTIASGWPPLAWHSILFLYRTLGSPCQVKWGLQKCGGTKQDACSAEKVGRFLQQHGEAGMAGN